MRSDQYLTEITVLINEMQDIIKPVVISRELPQYFQTIPF